VDNFLEPGNLAGGFAHYKASHEGRIAMIRASANVASDHGTNLHALAKTLMPQV